MNAEEKHYFRIALAIVGAITLMRVIVLVLTPLDFYPDEAQYWWWAQTPDWGYFSKPPMIAWLIDLTTFFFGEGEWAVRIGSPLLHAAAALFVFGIARRVFSDARIGMLSALAYVTTPGISYSSGLISTDVPLLFFWAVGLYGFVRAMEDPRWRWALLTGIAFGLGLETKYAMFYFLLGAVVSVFLSADARKLVFSGRGVTILVIGLLLLVPNIMWNAAHGFPTVAHTEHNADWKHARFNIGEVAGFIGGQFGVFGPVLMIGLLMGLWKLIRSEQRPQGALVLAAFCVPPLVLIIIQSFISEANANWAATAYVAATPIAVWALAGVWHDKALWISFAIDGVAMFMMWLILLSPSFAEKIGQGNAFKRMEGWSELGAAVADEAKSGRYHIIGAANRSLMAELLYYAQPRDALVRMWDRDTHDDDHFQMTLRLPAPSHRVLMVLFPDEAGSVLRTFDSNTLVDTIAQPVGGHHVRVTQLYNAHDYRGPQPSH